MRLHHSTYVVLIADYSKGYHYKRWINLTSYKRVISLTKMTRSLIIHLCISIITLMSKRATIVATTKRSISAHSSKCNSKIIIIDVVKSRW